MTRRHQTADTVLSIFRLSLTQETVAEMMTVDISHWDETVCNMTACQHPPCWEAIQRIEKGQPRILVKDLNSLERHCSEREDELPTLKIFDLPLNYSYRGRIKHPGNSSPRIVKDSGKYCTSPRTVEAFVPPLSVFSPERNLFPGLNSRVESHPPHYTPINLTSLKQVEKIQVTDLGDLAALKLGFQPAYGNLIVKWIPDMRHKLLLSERPTKRIQTPTQKMCVKELALEGILSFKNSKETCYPNLQKRKKPNKVPTGGQPYLLHLRRHPKIPANKSSNPTGRERKAVERPAGKRKILPQYLSPSPVAELQRKIAIHLENKKKGSPGSREKEESPINVQKTPTLCRFEPQIPMQERDLRRLQSHLQVVLEGSGIPKHLVSSLAQQMNGTALNFRTSPACGLRNEGERLLYKTYLLQEATSEKMRLPKCSPQTSGVNRMKPSPKFQEYRSSTASVFMRGYNSNQMSKSESKYKQYCKQIAIRREASGAHQQRAESCGSRELWLQKAAQKLESRLQSPYAPPPSPLIFECNEDPSQDLT